MTGSLVLLLLLLIILLLFSRALQPEIIKTLCFGGVQRFTEATLPPCQPTEGCPGATKGLGNPPGRGPEGNPVFFPRCLSIRGAGEQRAQRRRAARALGRGVPGTSGVGTGSLVPPSRLEKPGDPGPGLGAVHRVTLGLETPPV